jgi:hypothetical protein
MDIIPLMQKGFAGSSKRIAKISENFSGDEIFFRPYDKVNHLAWEVGHLAYVRNTITKILNPAEKLSFLENEKLIFAPGTPLLSNETFPPFEQILTAFQQRGERIIELLNNLTEEHWESESPFQLPMGTTRGSQIWTFFLHESFHLGEISYLKNIMLRIKE